MRVDAFDFSLPQNLIALTPVSPRDHAKLLCVGHGGETALTDRHFFDLPGLLRRGDVLICNDTRVIPAALTGSRVGVSGSGVGVSGSGARVSVTLHKRIDGQHWRAYARPGRKLKIGDRIIFGSDQQFSARVAEKGDHGEVLLAFSCSGTMLDQLIAVHGTMPLPPYIRSKRGVRSEDATDYQTIYATHDGAIAAPTAGLHFTPELFSRLNQAGVRVAYLTLHVGAGTFLPIHVDHTENHRMHSEWGEITPQLANMLNQARQEGGRWIAVGTTVLRLLESATDKNGRLHPFSGETDIFITPGHCFHSAELMITNFHLPRSTLFMLVAAFCGLDVIHDAYRHAICAQYRFYSYGDACLLSRCGNNRQTNNDGS